MGGQSFRTDTLGMSEAIGVAILIGLTITVTAMVGLNVLVFSANDDTGGPQANFSYDHVEGNGLLLITHERGDELKAGTIEITGPTSTVTWAEAANRNESSLVGPGDIAQIGSENAYGETVNRRDTIRIYVNRSGNRTQVSAWNGG